MADERPYRVRLADLLVWLADDLEGHGSWARAGICRQAARELVRQPPCRPEPDDGRCPHCGGEVVQPDRGRRRRWCSARCRQAAHRHAGVT